MSARVVRYCGWRRRWRDSPLGYSLSGCGGGGIRVGGELQRSEARRLTDESQKLQQQQTRLESQWSQLLLEHSTWGSYARVERLAREELGMKLPKTDERVLIRP